MPGAGLEEEPPTEVAPEIATGNLRGHADRPEAIAIGPMHPHEVSRLPFVVCPLPPGVVAEALTNGHACILEANADFAELFGRLSADDLVGRSLLDLLPNPGGRRLTLSQHLGRQRLIEGRPHGSIRCYAGVEGRPVTVAWRARGVADPIGGVTNLRIACISIQEGEVPVPGSEAENVWLCAEAMERTVDLALERERRGALLTLGLAMAADGDPRVTMRLGARLLHEQLESPLVKVMEHVPGVGGLVVRASVGFVEADGCVLPVGLDSQAGHTWRSGTLIVSSDSAAEHRFGESTLLLRHGARSGVTAPILGRSRIWGVLSIHDRVARAFDPEDIPFVQVVANLLGEAIARAAAEHQTDSLGRVLEHAPLLVGRFDAQRTLQYLNGAARTAFGFGPTEDVTGRLVNRLIRPREQNVDLVELDGQMAQGVTSRCDCTCTRLNGEQFIATVGVQGEAGPDGGIHSFAFFGIDITERTASRVALEASLGEVRTLAVRLDAAKEEQAQHCAMELHDDLGQTLAAARLAVHAITRGTPAQVPERAATALHVLEESLDSLRRITREMRPMLLELGEVEKAFRTLCATHAERMGIPVRFVASGSVGGIGLNGAVGLFRVAQEALSNATRHGHASAIELALVMDAGGLASLTVTDDGCGFDALARGHTGMGLVGMRERMLGRGGTFEVRSQVGSGTRIVAALPGGDKDVPGG